MKLMLRLHSLTLALGCLFLSSTGLAQTTNWVKANPTTNPGARYTFGMAHDWIRKRTVVFGGTVPGVSNYANDTWEYNGTSWAKVTTQKSPPGRRVHAMAYHMARLKTVLFGGLDSANNRLSDTWEYDGTNWTQMKPLNSPSGRRAHGMAYDSARNVTVLFGGAGSPGNTTYNDTWEWNGTNWTKINTKNSPQSRFVGGMAYDSARKVVVLFGGYWQPQNFVYLNDTWEYNGKNWTLKTPTNKPSIRCCHALAYDQVRQRIVLFGGYSPTAGSLQDTWEYDGKNWTPMNPTNKPTARYDFDHMVYDKGRRRMVLFGGRSGGGPMNDTWEYVDQSLIASPPTISIATGGTHTFSLNANTNNANRLYWIFGSVSGTASGVKLYSAIGSVIIPLVPDAYTDITIGLPNTGPLINTRGTLNSAGKATASLKVPKNLPKGAIGLSLHHSYLVYDAKDNFYMASNPTTLMLTP